MGPFLIVGDLAGLQVSPSVVLEMTDAQESLIMVRGVVSNGKPFGGY